MSDIVQKRTCSQGGTYWKWWVYTFFLYSKQINYQPCASKLIRIICILYCLYTIWLATLLGGKKQKSQEMPTKSPCRDHGNAIEWIPIWQPVLWKYTDSVGLQKMLPISTACNMHARNSGEFQKGYLIKNIN